MSKQGADRKARNRWATSSDEREMAWRKKAGEGAESVTTDATKVRVSEQYVGWEGSSRVFLEVGSSRDIMAGSVSGMWLDTGRGMPRRNV